SINSEKFLDNGYNRGTTFKPGLPDRSAPTIDHRISITAGLGLKNMLDSDFSPLLRDRQSGPCLGAVCKVHVRTLHLTPCIPLLDVQIQPDKSEHDSDGLGRFIRALGGIGIHSELVNEGGIRVSESVES